MMHLRMDSVECIVWPCLQVRFFRGLKSLRFRTTSCCERWRANYPDWRLAPRRYSRTHSFTQIIHSHYTTRNLGIRWTFNNSFYFKGPNRHFCFKCAHYFFIFLTVWYNISHFVRTRQITLFTVKYKSGYSIVTLVSASLLLLSTVAPLEFGLFWFWSWSYC